MLIIKKIIAVFAAFTLIMSQNTTAFAEDTPAVSAKSAVLMHGDEVLFEKDSHVRLPMASTTKLMTAILALENCDADSSYVARYEWCNIEGSSMYLSAGENYSVLELVTGLLLASGNDAAEALACITAGSKEAFAEMMNAKAAELGMEDTHFTNPSGLPDDNHYSTAYDMALLMNYCMTNSLFCEITSLKSAEIKNQHFTNHNKLLTIYNGCKGGKTGYTISAGRCLASYCERDGLAFTCVTLCAPDDWNDHAALYDWAYDNYRLVNAAEEAVYVLPIVGGESQNVLVRPKEDIPVFAKKGERLKYICKLPPFLFAPVNALEPVGNLSVILNGTVIAEAELCCCQSVGIRIYERSITHDRKTSENNIRLGRMLPQKSGGAYKRR